MSDWKIGLIQRTWPITLMGALSKCIRKYADVWIAAMCQNLSSPQRHRGHRDVGSFRLLLAALDFYNRTVIRFWRGSSIILRDRLLENEMHSHNGSNITAKSEHNSIFTDGVVFFTHRHLPMGK